MLAELFPGVTRQKIRTKKLSTKSLRLPLPPPPLISTQNI